MERRPLGLSLGLRTPQLPATHAEAGTVLAHRTRRYVSGISRTSFDEHHCTRATSCRTTWLSHEACTGRWIMRAFGNASDRRAAAVQPRCEEPLSTIQNTRRAVAYGLLVMTFSTSSVNGAMPVVCGAVPDHVRAVHVVGGQVCQGAVSAVFGFHPHRLATRPGRCALVDAAAGLHARLLIGAEDEVVFSQWLAVEHARVEI